MDVLVHLSIYGWLGVAVALMGNVYYEASVDPEVTTGVFVLALVFAPFWPIIMLWGFLDALLGPGPD
jgi:hypothetical protein